MLSKEGRMAQLLYGNQWVQDTFINWGSQAQTLSVARQKRDAWEMSAGQGWGAGEHSSLYCIPGQRGPPKNQRGSFCCVCVCFNVQSPDFQMLAIIFLQRLCVLCEMHLAYKPTVDKPITAHNNFMLGANPLSTIIYNKKYNCQVHLNSHFGWSEHYIWELKKIRKGCLVT